VDLLDSIQATMEQLEGELIEQVRSRVPVAFEIGSHILQSGGKRIRPQLAILAARMGGYTGSDAVKLSGAIEAIHTATLLHDDVVDHAETRRGRPAANTVWSNEMCVLGGDFLLSRAFAALTSIGNLRILEIVAATTCRLSEGELFQMSHIGNVDLTEDDYLRIIADKTAILMETACRGGAILGGLDARQEGALAAFGFGLGMAFQITDDVIDYRSDKKTMGKAPGMDLLEGKLTLPLIAALKRADDEERRRLRSIIVGRQLDDGDFEWVRGFLERRGGLQEALEKGRACLNTAKEQLSSFGDSYEKNALLGIAERILHRTY
jgi:octaprenyl-diphosphate synthase